MLPDSKISRYQFRSRQRHALAPAFYTLEPPSCSPFSVIKTPHSALRPPPREQPSDGFRGSDPPPVPVPAPAPPRTYRVGAGRVGAARPSPAAPADPAAAAASCRGGGRAAALPRGGGQRRRPSPPARPPPSRPARGGAAPGALLSGPAAAEV